MKIRNGFVSNSSSSSFIVSTEAYKTTKAVAKQMLKVYKDYEKYLASLLNIKDPNMPIAFRSCNYDTYIRKFGKYIIVCTCNNEDWDIEKCHAYTDFAKSVVESLTDEQVKISMRYMRSSINDINNLRYQLVEDIVNNELDSFYTMFDDYYVLEEGAVGYFDNNDKFVPAKKKYDDDYYVPEKDIFDNKELK